MSLGCIGSRQHLDKRIALRVATSAEIKSATDLARQRKRTGSNIHCIDIAEERVAKQGVTLVFNDRPNVGECADTHREVAFPIGRSHDLHIRNVQVMDGEILTAIEGSQDRVKKSKNVAHPNDATTFTEALQGTTQMSPVVLNFVGGIWESGERTAPGMDE